MDEPGTGIRRPKPRPRSVGPRIGLFAALLAVVVGCMLLLGYLARRIGPEPGGAAPEGGKEPATAALQPGARADANALSPVPSDANAPGPFDSQPPAAPADPNVPSPAASDPNVPPAPADANAAPAEVKSLEAHLAEAAQGPFPEAPPWPSEADLPILSRYRIDWQRGAVRMSDVRDHVAPPPDDDPTDDIYEFDEAAFYFLVRTVATLPREAFRIDPNQAEPDLTDYDAMLSLPKSFRGTPVTVSGAVHGVAEWQAPQPKVAGFDHVYKIELYKPTAGRLAPTCTLFVFDNPGKLLGGTQVRARGYFYRIRDYEVEHKNPDTGENEAYRYSAPVVVARHVDLVATKEPVAPRVTGRQDTLLLVTGVAVVALAAMIFFFVRRLIARGETFRRDRRREELTADDIHERIEYLQQLEKSRRQ